jgi:hypothetical protein
VFREKGHYLHVGRFDFVQGIEVKFFRERRKGARVVER